MLPPLVWNILLLIPIAMVVVVPPVGALLSREAHGARKAGWVLASLTLSWLGYSVYYHFWIRKRRGN